ncbi:MAG: histidinol dehydrogenase, partial [Candidatus Limnocylindrales bacterium]
MTTPSSPAADLKPLPRIERLDLRRAGEGAVRDRAFQVLARRGAVPDPATRSRARELLDEVSTRGSGAVRELNQRFGGGRTDGRLVLSGVELELAATALAPDIRMALEAAIANVRRFAETQRPSDRTTTIVPGVDIERRWVPVERVGAYVPGGGAAYPSSLVMTVVPAQVAGVDSIVVATPAA